MKHVMYGEDWRVQYDHKDTPQISSDIVKLGGLVSSIESLVRGLIVLVVTDSRTLSTGNAGN